MVPDKNTRKIIISIILPVFNGENYLEEAIESCLSQTFGNFELIIVDDCSSDNSRKIAERFEKVDSRVTLIRNAKNLKLPASLNVGHLQAKGDYITWISHDNLFNKEALWRFHEEIKVRAYDIIYSKYELIDLNGKFLKEIDFSNEKSLLLGNTIGASFLYRKEVYKRNVGYNIKLHLVEDYDFWLKASLHSSIFYLNENLYKFRSHKDSLSFLISNDEENNKDYAEKIEAVYANFFQELNIGNRKIYACYLSRFHAFKQVNILKFMKHYKILIRDLSIALNENKNYDIKNFKRELDQRIRSNLLYNKSNQNIFTLFQIFKVRPKILLGYDKRTSFKILKNLLFS